MGTALGGATFLLDVAGEAAEAFGPLKAVLGVISTVYEKYEVRLRPGAQNTFLTDPFAGNSCCQAQDSRPLITHSCTGGGFQNAHK
jgi:hypothetical protein